MKLLFLSLLFSAVAASATSLDNAYNATVTAEALSKLYAENEVAADAKYGGARVSVGGMVYRVGKDEDGNPYVILVSNDPDALVYCKFPEAFNARIAQLRPRSLIGIRGVVVGLRNRRVIVKDCSL